MPKRSFSPLPLSLKVFVFSLSIMAVPSQAFAGFQWVSPQETGAAPSAAPSAEVSPAPVIVEAPDVLIDPLAQTPKKQELPSSLTIAPTPMPAADLPLVAPEKEMKPVRGFANNVPLAVALRQILPPEYGFSVDQDVNMGMLVSWRGGKAWQAALQDMLQESGLSMREQGQMVSISRVRGGEKTAAPAPALTKAGTPSPMTLTPSPYEKNPSQLLASPSSLPAPLAALAPAPALMEPVSVAPPMGVVSATTVPAVSLDAPDVWVAERGQTLRGVIEAWCAKVGIELSWQAEYDYPVQVPFAFTGKFEDGVRTILKGFEEAQPQPAAALHNNPAAGQSVLVVTARGNNYGE